MGVVGDQNDVIDTNIKSLKTALITNENLYLHQADTYNTIRLANYLLIFAYAFFFVLIHVLYADQYLRGVPRNEIVDSIFLTIFFLYPYLIYSVEGYFYDAIMGIWAYLYSKTNIPSLDSLFASSTYYEAPNVINSDFQQPIVRPGPAPGPATPEISFGPATPGVSFDTATPGVSFGPAPGSATIATRRQSSRQSPAAATTARQIVADCYSDLNNGQCLDSRKLTQLECDARCGNKLVLDQNFGDLIKYDVDNNITWRASENPSWSSGNGSPYILKLDSSGNASIYDARDTVTWSTSMYSSWNNSTTPGPYFMRLDVDGNIVIYGKSGPAVWHSNTAGCTSKCSSQDKNGLCHHSTDTYGPILTSGYTCKSRLEINRENGQLYLVSADGKQLWTSGIAGNAPPYRVIMKNDGNLVVKDNSDRTIWQVKNDTGWKSVNAAGTPPYTLKIKDDGRLYIYDANFKVMWHTIVIGCNSECHNGVDCPQILATSYTCGHRMEFFPESGVINIVSTRGDVVWTNTKEIKTWGSASPPVLNTRDREPPYRLVLQDAGNLIICDKNNQPAWANTGVAGNDKPYRLIMQDDGNLVIYDKNNKPIWATSTDNSCAPIQPAYTFLIHPSTGKALDGNALGEFYMSNYGDTNEYQKWQHTTKYQLKHKVSGKCLDLVNNNSVDLKMSTCNDDNSQKWDSIGVSGFKNRQSGKCLDFYTNPYTYTCYSGTDTNGSGKGAQQWLKWVPQ